MSSEDEVSHYVNYQTPVLCDGCWGMVNVNFYCINCPGNLCDNCKVIHPNNNLTRTHQVLDRNHPSVIKFKKSSPEPCKHHPGKTYITFCVICKVPCCVSCLTEKHNGHSIDELDKYAEKSREEIRSFIKAADKELIPLTETTIRELEEKEEKSKLKKKEDEDAVKVQTAILRKQVDDLGKDALTQLDRLFSKRKQDISLQKAFVEERNAYFKILVESSKRRLNKGGNLEALIIQSELSCMSSLQLPEIIISNPPELKLSSYEMPSADVSIGEFLSSTGKISDLKTFPEDKTYKENGRDSDKDTKTIKEYSESSSKEKAALFDELEASLGEVFVTDEGKGAMATYYEESDAVERNALLPRPPPFNDRMLSLKRLTAFNLGVSPHSMALSEKDDIWIMSSAKIDRYNEKGISLFHRPLLAFDIAISPSNDLIFADEKNNQIMEMNETGNVTPLVCTTPLSPRGICINNEKQLAIGLGKKNPPLKLVVYDLKTTKILHEIRSSHFKHDIYRVTQNRNGDYIVADTNSALNKFTSSGKVLSVTLEGKCRWEYQMNGVNDVVCDEFHNVIAADKHSKEIILLNSEGIKRKTIISSHDGILCPVSLSIKNNCLVIGQWTFPRGKVHIVKYVK